MVLTLWKMENETMKINSKWSMEKADWDRTFQQYTNRRVISLSDKELEMVVKKTDRGDVLQFIGGPTGHEAYYISDLLGSFTLDGSDDFCICAGTVNSWPLCTVSRKEVLNFLRSQS